MSIPFKRFVYFVNFLVFVTVVVLVCGNHELSHKKFEAKAADTIYNAQIRMNCILMIIPAFVGSVVNFK